MFPMMKFREALLFWLDARKVSLRQVSLGSNVSYEQLKKIKQIETRTTNVDDAIKVAHFFGLSLEGFLAGHAGSDHDALIRTLDELSPQAREVLKNAADAQLAAERLRSEKSDQSDE
mmetsp:Transcript_27660/g.51389  ORF Transcript_27660/g.51389 Transcript_27660/m.51389 type:complete len:117 (-) Transcript_27660:2135-2485(-)